MIWVISAIILIAGKEIHTNVSCELFFLLERDLMARMMMPGWRHMWPIWRICPLLFSDDCRMTDSPFGEPEAKLLARAQKQLSWRSYKKTWKP